MRPYWFARFGILLLLAELLAFHAAVASVDQPYQVEVFDRLCPAASDTSRYETSLLKSLKYLIGGTDGWLYRSKSDFLQDFGANPANYNGLQKLAKYLAHHGTRLMLVYLPTRGLMNPEQIPPNQFDHQLAYRSYREKLDTLRSLGLIVPDMAQLVDQFQGKNYFFKRDIHWTPDGARETAELIGRVVDDLHLVQRDPQYRFTNVPAGSYTIRGGMARGVKELCGAQFIPDYVQGYRYETSFAPGEEQLFGERSGSETVLIGTSFSALERLNFLGFLQKAIGGPIDSYARGGGGDEGAWLEYAASGEFQANPPKLIIWEVPGYYLLDENEVFAQILPTLRGGCGQSGPLLEETVSVAELARTKRSLFFTDQLVNRSLNEIVLDLEFSDPMIRRLVMRLWYKNGKTKRMNIRVPAKARTEGHFVLSLHDDLLSVDSPVMALELIEIDGEPLDDYVAHRSSEELSVAVTVCANPEIQAKTERK